MTKRIRMSEAVQQAKGAKPRVNHAWIAGFGAINGHWATMTGKLIWIKDSIAELRGGIKGGEFYLENVDWEEPSGQSRQMEVEMKWVLKVIAGGARALIPVSLLAAFMLLALGSASAQNSRFISDSPPIGGTGDHEIQIIVASMPTKISIPPLGSRLCNATLSIDIYDVKNLEGAPVAAVTDAPLLPGESLRLTHIFEPGVGDQRQDVVFRVALLPEPKVGTSHAAFFSVCSFTGSAQVVNMVTGETLSILCCYPETGTGGGTYIR